MSTLPQALVELSKRRNELADNLITKGVNAEHSEALDTLIPKVLEISGESPVPIETGFVIDPRWNWWDLKDILTADNTPYIFRVAEAIYNGFPTTTITIGSGIVAVRTSDGQYYTSNATHTWDVSQDRQLYTVQQNTSGEDMLLESVKARYIIKYYSTEDIDLTPPHECFYFVVDAAKFKNTGLGNMTAANAKKSLIYFDLINGADLQSSLTSMSYMFNNCYSLKAVPFMNTSRITNAANLFSNCYSLVFVPNLDFSAVTSTARMFENCYALQIAPPLDVIGSSSMIGVFQNCYSLMTIPLMNIRMMTSTNNNMLTGAYSLVTANIKNLRGSFEMNIAPYLLSRDSIMFVIHNRYMEASGNATLSLGAINLAKLSDEDKAIAAANRITLA